MIELGVTPTMIQPVILCGGSGTRLWPLSREHFPKQLHALNGERTLLQETAARCEGLAAGGAPLVVCNENHRFMVADQLRRAGRKPRGILLAPLGRGTAPALTLAAVHAVTADDPVLLAMPSDHFIRDDAAFRRAIARGAELARRGYLVTFGIPPLAPETGYGYIRAGGPLGADARELGLHHEAMRFVADDERLADRRHALAAARRFLEQRALAVQGVQRLRMVLARQRPQASARAAAQDHRLDQGGPDAKLDHCHSRLGVYAALALRRRAPKSVE